MYKQASRLKLRFSTEKGELTVDQLWDCTRAMLGRTIKAVNDILKDIEPTGDLDFLNDDSVATTDPENTLRFKILKDIYITKKEEAEALRDEAKIKAHNEKIDGLILAKKEQEMGEMTVEQLEALRK